MSKSFSTEVSFVNWHLFTLGNQHERLTAGRWCCLQNYVYGIQTDARFWRSSRVIVVILITESFRHFLLCDIDNAPPPGSKTKVFNSPRVLKRTHLQHLHIAKRRVLMTGSTPAKPSQGRASSFEASSLRKLFTKCLKCLPV